MSRIAHPNRDNRPPVGIDWRGWIAVAWVVGWGVAYALMAIQARAPQVLRWIEQIGRGS